MTDCPCGSGRDRDTCCGPVVAGERRAETAEALMRARYTAHTEANMDFIVATHDPATRDEIDRDGTLAWARDSDWLGLRILDARAGGVDDPTGEIEFIARYREQGENRMHHECARFARDADGGWMFVDGEAPTVSPVRREAPKVGRNDPCPCGSGRKHKKCCGRAA